MGKRRRVEVEAVAAGVTADGAQLSPYVCYFPNGVPPASTSEAGGYAEDIDFSMYGRPSGGRSLGQQVLVGSRDRVDYVGSTSSEEYTVQQPCSYAVGVFDKATGKLELLPVQGGKILRMEARLQGLDYGPSVYTAQEQISQQEVYALNKKLVDSFGSTRRRRQLTAIAEGIVVAEKIGSVAALEKAMAKGVEDAQKTGVTKENVMAKESKVRNLPPHNVEACTPQEAYVLTEIIPPITLQNLNLQRFRQAAQSYEYLEMLRTKQWESEYVLDRVHLLNDPDKVKVQYRAQALAFLSALIKLVNASPDIYVPRNGIDQVAKKFSVLPAMMADLLEHFYNHQVDGEKDRYSRSDQQRELMLAYIMVVAQLLEGGGLAGEQFEALRKELKMNPSDLTMRLREVGSTCSATTMKSKDSSESVRTFNVMLLKDGKPLGECFPNIKLGPKKKK